MTGPHVIPSWLELRFPRLKAALSCPEDTLLLVQQSCAFTLNYLNPKPRDHIHPLPPPAPALRVQFRHPRPARKFPTAQGSAMPSSAQLNLSPEPQ